MNRPWTSEQHATWIEERQRLGGLAAESHYVNTEMIEPLIGATIVDAWLEVDTDTGMLVPAFKIKHASGRTFVFGVWADDEQNNGGRILFADID
ncbi:hypothetical protein UFOVP1131_118 [uncultured Caudovirales phage]|uniref:Uncharacterized protein n=1 Tax=uncultured Caudovirales phage TaxID=2100421 RepID=A0A6J5RE32_9CAUD|nr:hypothetical protein UFOVP966_9 [uncultured Caudovirales phage]CAB4185004.1 hypothetical protein UFOVP1131_118 [uncultured Caudovirales phage]CAB4192716.1 hypothetical protein UFOVP1245_68 [uncultured Caudovirales phage]CAB5231554.1 hypothetical protein UFOVP1582_110 [uncultured Caudovirales phage]